MKNKEKEKTKSLIKNSIILFVGKFSTQFISFLLLPLYTFFFTSEDYGFVDLITTYVILLVPVLTIQTEMYVFRYLIDCRNDDNKKSEIISNSFFVIFVLTLIALIVFAAVTNIIQIKYSIYIAITVVSTIIINILLQIARGFGSNANYSIACIITAVSNAILNFILIYILKWGIVTVFISTIISNVCGSIYLIGATKIHKYISFNYINKNKLKEIVAYSLPLVPNGIVWWIVDTSDRTIISLILGLSYNGIYSISNKFSHIINSFYSIFNMSWTESVSMYLYDDDKYLEKTFNSIFKLLCSSCLILLNSMFILFKIFVKGDYGQAYNYAFILIIASIFSMLASNLSAIYIAAKKTKKIAITTIIAAILNLSLHLLLINNIELYAAAISTLISFFILFIIRLVDIQKITHIKIDKKAIITFVFLFSLSYMPYFSSYIIFKLIWLLICLVFVIMINKELTVKIYYKFFKRG